MINLRMVSKDAGRKHNHTANGRPITSTMYLDIMPNGRVASDDVISAFIKRTSIYYVKLAVLGHAHSNSNLTNTVSHEAAAFMTKNLPFCIVVAVAILLMGVFCILDCNS